jgi:hypothetical protein
MIDRQKLEKWIARQNAEQIRVRHVSALGKTDGEVLVVAMVGEEMRSPAVAADMVCESLQEDANGIGGLQSYVIAAIVGEKSVARLPVRIDGESDDIESDNLSTEPANKTGLLAQLMRHNEALGRSLVMHQDAMFRSMARVISQVSEQNEHMREKHMEQVEVTEQLLSEQHERELKTAEANARIENISQMAKTVQTYLPVVVSKFMAHKAGGNVAPIDGDAISTLKDSLMSDPERMSDIMDKLTDQEKHALIKLITPNQGD